MFKKMIVSLLVVAGFALNVFCSNWEAIDPSCSIKMKCFTCVKTWNTAIQNGPFNCLFAVDLNNNIYRIADIPFQAKIWEKLNLPYSGNITHIAAYGFNKILIAVDNGSTYYWDGTYWNPIFGYPVQDLCANENTGCVSSSDNITWDNAPGLNNYGEPNKTRGPISLTDQDVLWFVSKTYGNIYYKRLGTGNALNSTYNPLRDFYGTSLPVGAVISDLAAGYNGQFLLNQTTGKVHMYWLGTIGKKGWWDVSVDNNGNDYRAKKVECNKAEYYGWPIAYIIVSGGVNDGRVFKREILTGPYGPNY